MLRLLLIFGGLFIASHSYANIIVTGAPGSGKSSLILGLELQGKRVMHEAARDFLQYQLIHQAAKDVYNSDHIMQRQHGIIDLHIKRESNVITPNTFTYVDSSPLDSLAYLLCEHKMPSKELLAKIESWLQNAPYQKKVIFLHYKPRTLNDDPLRPESTEQSLLLETYMREVYVKYGFELIEVPFLPIKERVIFVLQQVSR